MCCVTKFEFKSNLVQLKFNEILLFLSSLLFFNDVLHNFMFLTISKTLIATASVYMEFLSSIYNNNTAILLSFE